MSILIFDIETVPDVASGRNLYELADLTDQEVGQAMFKLRRQETGGSDFLRLHLQRIVAISVVFRNHEQLKVQSLAKPDALEPEIISRFFALIDKYTPTLVSWNGGGFDLPVLHYRALLHGISTPRYWESGEQEQSFRYNNYLNRFHYRHMDLMDILAGYQARANAPLNEIACMLGLPGKMGMHGGQVWDYFLDGKIEAIRNYCETDVLNTYLVYLRFELIRGNFDKQQYADECQRVRDFLQQENKPHFNEFLQAWPQNSPN